MGRQYKASIARLNNFKRPENSQKALVEDISGGGDEEDLPVSGPEAAWANRKYHSHRTLPRTWP
jgi:hypothetical protein